MKTKDKKALKEKNIAELEKLLIDKEQEVIKTRADMFRGKIKNIRSVKNLKNEIARIKTLIREKQLLEGKQSI
ncbi:MAG: 50S ribosomal protein L29 [Patescibacteria group bacterium]